MKAFRGFMSVTVLLLGLLLAHGTPALADIYSYVWDSGRNGWRQLGVASTDPRDHIAYICHGGECVEALCAACHVKPPLREKFTRQEREAHFSRHFPTIELRVGEGQETSFAGATLIRERNRLVLVDAKGVKRAFPAGALLLGKSGAPMGIAYSGSTPPP
jgi:hypothetical protein